MYYIISKCLKFNKEIQDLYGCFCFTLVKICDKNLQNWKTIY